MLLTLLLAAALGGLPSPQNPSVPVTSVGPIAITVSDLDRSVEFFTHTLDFQLESRDEQSGDQVERTFGLFGARIQTATLRLGSERIQLVDFLTPGGRDVPVDSRSNDRWFQHIAIVVSDMDAAFARLRNARVSFASTSPQKLPDWNPSAGGIEAFYFKDPDNHALEIIHFPPGKGDPRWNSASTRTAADGGSLFLGIDHTAIVTADTDRDLAFYQGVLGFRIAGTSDNYGLEQERLNNVFGAHLRITALRAPGGPGIELLEYLTPTTGRDFPRDTRCDDLWHWHITLIAGPGIDAALAAARAPRISAPPASPHPTSHPAVPFLIRDPDGHALMFAAPAAPQRRAGEEPRVP